MIFKTIASVAPLLCLLSSTFAFSSDAAVSPFAKALAARNGVPDRELRASTRASELGKRSDSIVIRKSIDLHYSEGENLRGTHVVAATVHGESENPIVSLEEIEHLTEYIECQAESISVRLLPHVAKTVEHDAWLSLSYGGMVVTSHYGCNAHGERKLFSVGDVSVDQDGLVILLNTKDADWATSFTSLDVQVHHTAERHIHRRQEMRFVRRQESVSATASYDPTPSIPAPTATQTTNSSSLDVNYPFIDKEIPLPGDAGANVHLKCKNCSTFGKIDFAFASFSRRDFGDTNNETGLQLGDFFTGGEARIVTKGLGAKVELEIGLDNDGGFDVPLFEVPLLYALAIPAICKVGLLYTPSLHFLYSLNGSLTFTTGFEIAVPDDSQIFIDLTEPNNSSASGFDRTTITPVPFQASVDVQSVQLSVALRHQVQIGFDFVNKAGVDMGVYLDLPKFGANFTKKSGVDENCTALATSASENKNVAQKVLKEVLSIEPTVDWGVGIAGELHFLSVHDDFNHSFVNGTFTNVDGQCLVFDGNTGAYVKAEDVVSKAIKSNAVHVKAHTEVSLMAAFAVALFFLV